MSNNNWEDGNLSFLDILAILSFIIGLENLELNEKQSSNLEKHLSQQDESLLSKIISQNEEIIKLENKIIELLNNRIN